MSFSFHLNVQGHDHHHCLVLLKCAYTVCKLLQKKKGGRGSPKWSLNMCIIGGLLTVRNIQYKENQQFLCKILYFLVNPKKFNINLTKNIIKHDLNSLFLWGFVMKDSHSSVIFILWFNFLHIRTHTLRLSSFWRAISLFHSNLLWSNPPI